jgi:hypothetical protein
MTQLTLVDNTSFNEWNSRPQYTSTLTLQRRDALATTHFVLYMDFNELIPVNMKRNKTKMM